MLQNLLSAAVVIGTLRVNPCHTVYIYALHPSEIFIWAAFQLKAHIYNQRGKSVDPDQMASSEAS